MAKVVFWTTEAEDTFENVIQYLQENWTENEIEHFVNLTNRIVSLISENPKMFRKTNVKNVHEALVTSHNLLVYKIYQERIDLLFFWDTRKNPVSKKLHKSRSKL